MSGVRREGAPLLGVGGKKSRGGRGARDSPVERFLTAEDFEEEWEGPA